jgi:dTDP-L-rhamnose 4-epimerase
VHVDDVAEAFAIALESPTASGPTFNVASGENYSVREAAELLGSAMGVSIVPKMVGQARVGDIRHCFADTTKARRELGFLAKRKFAEGLEELATWVAQQKAVDRVEQARHELESRGLVA